MKVFLIVSGCVLLVALGYLTGNVFPYSGSVSEPAATQLTLLVRIFALVATFLAVVVALLKEDIKKIWNYANVIVEEGDSGGLQEILPDIMEQQQEPMPESPQEALKYEYVLYAKNTGSVIARDCRIIVERLSRITDVNKEVEIDLERKPIPWLGADENKINLPPSAFSSFVVVSCEKPQHKKSSTAAD